MKTILILIVSVLLILVTGCSRIIPSYKIDVQQGNIITQHDINKVRNGMTQNQVRYILGTPLIRDAFHKSRWDYVYTLNHGRRKAVKKRVSILFSGGKVIEIEGDLKPKYDPNATKRPQTTVVELDPGKKKKKGIIKRIFTRDKK